MILVMVALPQTPPLQTALIYKNKSLQDHNFISTLMRIIVTLVEVWMVAAWAFHGYLILFGVMVSVARIWSGIKTLKAEKINKLSTHFQKYLMLQLLTCYANVCFQRTIFLSLAHNRPHIGWGSEFHSLYLVSQLSFSNTQLSPDFGEPKSLCDYNGRILVSRNG